ncbi:MAG: hypothetical protein WCJ39_04880, partial [bacterium]
IQGERIFDVGGTSSNSSSNSDVDNFSLTTDDSTPSTLSRVDLTVKARDSSNSTVIDYNDDIIFKVYYRTSSSNSWVQTTSSSYFAINSTYSSDYSDGIAFSSSRDGYRTFSNFIEFKKNYEYKVVVLDANDSSIQGERIFDVGGTSSNSSSSNVDGFSSKELDTVQRMYDNWQDMITQLRDSYSRLDSSTTRKNRSNTFYNDMEDILNDSSHRTYDTYDEFWSGFLSWSSYTINMK